MSAFSRNWLLAALAAGWMASAQACDTDDLVPDVDDGGLADAAIGDGDGDGDVGDGDVGDGDVGDGDAGDGDAMSVDPLLDAPEATMAGSVELDEPVVEVLHISGLSLGLHADGDVSILDLSDPTDPAVFAKLTTTGRVAGAAYDTQRFVLYLITISGDLRAYRVADVTAPVQAAQTTISDPGADADSIQGIVRVGLRLYALGQSQLLPVELLFGAGESIGFLAETPIAIEGSPFAIAAGAGRIYVALTGGAVQVWSSGASPALQGSADLGGDIVGWVVRGRRIFVALSGVGLRVVDLRSPDSPRTLFEAPQFDDLTALKRFGNLVLLALQRGLLVALDLSVLEAPRSLVTRAGTLPDWIAPAGGNLLLGSGTTLSVFGVPPFVASSVPPVVRGAFPRYGRFPIQLSKAIDPSSVSSTSITLRCGDSEISGTISISFDNRTLTFLPSASLPAGLDCTIAFDGITDLLGNALSGTADMMAITTADSAPEPVTNNRSSYAHTADGAFTDWSEGTTEDFEYFDVTAARGMYSHFYADFDGTRLWMLNDWYYNGDDIDPDCYNQFGVWTGGGSERWDIRAYGDQRIEVRLDGALLQDGDARVTGGYSYTATPNDAEEHTVYELSIAAQAGSWGVQLHDPGPTFGCDRLETDPTNYNGSSTAESSTIDPTTVPTVPTKPAASGGSGTLTSLTPTLAWTTEDAASNWTVYVFELYAGQDTSGALIYRRLVYGTRWALPAGLLLNGSTYTWRIIAYNLAGTTAGDPVTFTVNTGDSVSAPTVSNVSPDSVEQNSTESITVTGTGFVQGARVYAASTQLTTTYVSATELTAMLDDAVTSSTGTVAITVRNNPADDATTSNGFNLQVTEPTPPPCAHGECLPGARLASNCSSCATAVCASRASCCTTEWDAMCVDLAAASGSCSCSAPSLVSLDMSEITADSATTITVTLANGPSAVYSLVLAPNGGGSEIVASCNWTGANTCEASVNVPAETYDATIRVGQTPSYDTNTLSAALVASGGGGGGGGMCLAGTSAATVTGSGTCSDPFRIDLSATTLGDDWHFAVADTFSNDELDATIGASDASGTCAAGTARDIVLAISFPAATMVGTVSAEGVQVDPIITMSGDNACGQIPLTHCSDATGQSACETIYVDNPGSAEFYYVVSEATDSGQEIIVSLTSL